MQQHTIEDDLLSAEAYRAILRAWCEANPAIAKCTVRDAVDRLKCLENLWTAWKVVCKSAFSYDKSMTCAVKALERADKAIPRLPDDREPLPCCEHDI